jgi:hypothetical protein
MHSVFRATDEISVLPHYFPIAGMGYLPINAYVLEGKEPALIDTGIVMERENFIAALSSVIDPTDLRWIILTHDDVDHTGSLEAVLDLAPNARFLANPMAAMRQTTVFPVPMHRVRFLNPGESIDIGDRTLTAVRPPVFDNPTTIGLFDSKSRVYFSADSFGGVIPVEAEDAADVAPEALEGGIVGWAASDAPWLHLVDEAKLAQRLSVIRDMDPTMVLSAHLPPARGMNDVLLSAIAHVPSSPEAQGPTQADLEAMLAAGV